MLEIKNLSGDLGDFKLRDINLKVHQGEYLVILGPTGAGKSVLIEYVVGIYSPSSGTISIKGENILPLAIEERNIAYVPQDYALFPNLSVEKNIAYGLTARNLPADKIAETVDRTIKALKIENIRHRMPLHLSGGEKQRVALGRALATKPSLVLMDEPLCALDENLRSNMARELRRLQKETHSTFIHISHNFEEAADVADRIAIMNDGRLVQTGTLSEIKATPRNRFVAKFLKSYNIFDAKTDGTTISCNGRIFQKNSRFSGKVIVTIRPENIILLPGKAKEEKVNTFSGKICNVTAKPHLVEYTVDIGIQLTAFRIEPLAANIGDTVSVHLPGDHLVLLKEDC